jgi:hypothetical protein
LVLSKYSICEEECDGSGQRHQLEEGLLFFLKDLLYCLEVPVWTLQPRQLKNSQIKTPQGWCKSGAAKRLYDDTDVYSRAITASEASHRCRNNYEAPGMQ